MTKKYFLFFLLINNFVVAQNKFDINKYLCKDWVLVYEVFDENEFLYNDSIVTISFYKDSTFRDFDFSFNKYFTGIWEFNADDFQLITHTKNNKGNYSFTYKISFSDENNLTLYALNSTIYFERQLKSKE